MADLVPVDHQPEFDEADQAAMMPETFVNPAVKSAIESTTKLLAAPGNIAKPNPYPEGSEEASWYEDQRQKGMTNWSPEMALAMLGGGAAGVDGGGEVLGSGASRMRMIDNVDLHKELANLNRAKGYATGKAAEGHDFTRPGPEKGSVAENVAKMKAQLDADTQQSLLTIERNRGIPNNPYMSADDWAFIDGNIRKGNPTLGSGATDKKTAATLQAIRGLDMNQDARMARAGEQGYDTSTPLYHGTSKDADFNKFKDSRHGTWTTTDPAEASAYAKDNDSKGPVFDNGKIVDRNTADRVLPLYGKPLQNPYTGPVPDSIRTASNYKKAQSDWFDQLKRQGYDGVDMGGGVRVDFDNANMRSQFAPFDPKNQGKSMLLGSGATDQKTAAMLQAIRAYHGSPHNFDAFDLSKIGTGEGAQAYGHGLYFAENEGVAKNYRDQLAKDMYYSPKGEMFDPQSQLQHMNIRMAARNNGPDLDATIARANQLLPKASEQTRPMIEHDLQVLQSFKDAGGISKNPGHIYEVGINADPEHFIDWDKPLHEQSQFVKDAIAKHDASLSTQPPSLTQIKDPEIRSIVRRAVKANDGQAQGLEMTIDNDRGLYDAASKHAQRNKVDLDAQDMRASDYVYQQAKPYIDALHASQNLAGDSLGKLLGVKGADAMQSGPAAARLRDVGIPGIKYLDAGSRAGGEGSRNYVVFNDKLIDILRKYGIAGLPAAGAATGAMQAQPGPGDMVNAIRGQGGG